jgi:hypothetical protein
MKKTASMIFVLASVTTSSSALAAKKLPNLVKSCKKECPSAKTSSEAMACAEQLEQGADNAKFKKSKCYKDHEKYEAATGHEEAGEANEKK